MNSEYIPFAIYLVSCGAIVAAVAAQRGIRVFTGKRRLEDRAKKSEADSRALATRSGTA